MSKTTLLIAVALVASAIVATAPTAAAENIVDCGVFWTLEGHEPQHCLEDCQPDPTDCRHDEDDP